MSPMTTTLGVLVILIAVNQVMVKMPFVRQQPWLFWTIQGANLVVAGVALTVGMPGLVSTLKWIVAALFLFHFVVNLQTRTAWKDEDRALRRDAESRERRRQQEREEEAEELRGSTQATAESEPSIQVAPAGPAVDPDRITWKCGQQRNDLAK